MGLSLRRAEAVFDYMVQGGVVADRMRVEGYGEERPIASNNTAGGRAQNRRVELHPDRWHGNLTAGRGLAIVVRNPGWQHSGKKTGPPLRPGFLCSLVLGCTAGSIRVTGSLFLPSLPSTV
jgi:hypothetical protein